MKHFLIFLLAALTLLSPLTVWADTDQTSSAASQTSSSASPSSSTPSTSANQPVTSVAYPVGPAPAPGTTASSPAPAYPPQTTTRSPAPPAYGPPVQKSYGGWDPVIQPFQFTAEAIGAFFEGLGCLFTGKRPPRGWERKP